MGVMLAIVTVSAIALFHFVDMRVGVWRRPNSCALAVLFGRSYFSFFSNEPSPPRIDSNSPSASQDFASASPFR
jgi:hypothetical protein